MKQSLADSYSNSIFRKSTVVMLALVLALAALTPLLLSGSASAAQLTSRKVTINDSVASETGVQYDFQFSWSPATDVEGVRFQFCTTPLGACTKPTGMNINRSLATLDSHTGFPTNATAFTEYTGNANNCNDSAGVIGDTMYCIIRTEASSTTGTNATVDLGAITNPSSNQTIYVRVGLYDNATFTGSPIHDGTVAAAIVERLTITGRVQERLDFCVTAIQDGTALPANVAACPAVGDSAIDIGTIDNASVVASPVATTPTNGSDDDYGILMVNTNAANGVAIVYFVENATSVNGGDADQLRSFRVLPTDCNASAATLTDQCFQSASNAGSGTDFTAGTEMFGLQVPCIDNTQGTTTNFAGTTPDPYNNTDNSTAFTANCHSFDGVGGGTPDTGDSFGWNVSGTADALASSTSVVDDEIVKVRFGATASATTPTGSYVAVTTYIATPTF